MKLLHIFYMYYVFVLESPNVQVDEEGLKVRPNHKRCIVTVSYTHLDVYKRQGKHQVVGTAFLPYVMSVTDCIRKLLDQHGCVLFFCQQRRSNSVCNQWRAPGNCFPRVGYIKCCVLAEKYVLGYQHPLRWTQATLLSGPNAEVC